jgi:hypothetical protein
VTPLATRIHAIAEWLRTLDSYDAREVGERLQVVTPDSIELHDMEAYIVYGLLLASLTRLAEDRGWGVTASAMHGRSTVRFGDGYAVGSAETPIEAAASALEGLREKGIPKRPQYGAWPSPVSVDGEVSDG